MRVLVVEDFEPMARAIVTGLRREGMAVDVVYDGDAALGYLALTRYDVVVLDRDLPGVHGDEVCRRLAAGRSPSRILMLTAAGSLTDRVDGLNLSADDYLAKPLLDRGGQKAAGPDLPGAVTARLPARVPLTVGSSVLLSIAVAFAVMAALSVVAGWLIAGRFVRPLRAIITTARDISATNLHRRLGVRGRGDELTELGETLDDLFGRLEASFRAQQNFVANASHELRTPLSAGPALLQVALADPEPTVETLRATCEELVQLGDQQERLIAALLALARSQRGIGPPEGLDLADITRDAILARQEEAERHGIRLTAALAAAPVTGDPDLAESLVANLLNNAIRHNLPGGQVEISTALTTAGAVVSVSNTGPLVPPAAVQDLFQPFRQLGTQRTRHGEGHGIGLAIVRAIADAHGAAVTARARPDGGLHIEVAFP